MKHLFLLILLFSIIYPVKAQTSSIQQPEVVGYLADYYKSNTNNIQPFLNALDFKKLTIINLIRDTVGPEQKVASSSLIDFNLVIDKAHSVNTKVFLSIPKGSNWQESNIINSTNVDGYISMLMSEYVDSYRFDGIDLDFEFEENNSLYNDFPLFTKKLAEALHARNKELSITVLHRYQYLPNKLIESLPNADFINIMTYDNEKFNATSTSGYHNLQETFDLWTGANGIPKNKINIGLSFYGENTGLVHDSARAYDTMITTDNLFAYATPYKNMMSPTMSETQIKVQETLKRGYRGVMLWELSYDTFDNVGLEKYSLLSRISETIKGLRKPIIVELNKTVLYQGSGYDTLTFSWKNFSGDYTKEWFGIFEQETGQYAAQYFAQYTPNGSITLTDTQLSKLKRNTPYEIRVYTDNFQGYNLLGTSETFVLEAPKNHMWLEKYSISKSSGLPMRVYGITWSGNNTTHWAGLFDGNNKFTGIWFYFDSLKNFMSQDVDVSSLQPGWYSLKMYCCRGYGYSNEQTIFPVVIQP